MALIKPEKYTPLLKGYLTFPHNPTVKGIFLKEEYDTRYEVTIGNETVNEYKLKPSIRKEIEKAGAVVKPVRVLRTSGKSEAFGIPVQVRKIYNNNRVDVRVRVTGENVDELMDKVERIKVELAKFGVKPKVCLWDRVGQLK